MFNKLLYIAVSSVCFGFAFYVGNNIREGEDYSSAGVRGIVRFFGGLIEGVANLVGHSVVGYAIMAVAIFGGIYMAITIWRNDMFFNRIENKIL